MRKMWEVRKLMPRSRVKQLIEDGYTLKRAADLIQATSDQMRAIENETRLKFHRANDLNSLSSILTLENFKLWQELDFTRSDIARHIGCKSQTVGQHLKKFPEIKIRHSEKYNKKSYASANGKGISKVIKRSYKQKVIQPRRKFDDCETMSLLLPWVSNSPELKPEHGVA